MCMSVLSYCDYFKIAFVIIYMSILLCLLYKNARITVIWCEKLHSTCYKVILCYTLENKKNKLRSIGVNNYASASDKYSK